MIYTTHIFQDHPWLQATTPSTKHENESSLALAAQVASSSLGLAVGALAPSADRAMAMGGPEPRRSGAALDPTMAMAGFLGVENHGFWGVNRLTYFFSSFRG